jgi:hypothetical protein
MQGLFLPDAQGVKKTIMQVRNNVARIRASAHLIPGTTSRSELDEKLKVLQI